MTDGSTALEDRLRSRIRALSPDARGALAESLAVPGRPGRPELVAYLTAPGVKPRVDDLRALVQRRLPEYMVPARFVFVPELPRTPAGKLDRRAMAAGALARAAIATGVGTPNDPPRGAPAPSGTVTGPRTEAERILTEIWKAVLDTDEIDVHDDFFELGGDSILSIRIISRANQAGLAITPQQFFESPTIADLAVAAAEQPEDS